MRPVLGTSASWPVRVIASAPFISAPLLEQGSYTAIGIVAAGVSQNSPERVEAVDLRTGVVRRGPEVTAGSVVVGFGRNLYVIGPSAVTASGQPRGPYESRKLTLAPMELGRPIGIGELVFCPICLSPMSLQPSGSHRGGLWTAEAGLLRLVSPITGRVLAHVALPHFTVGDMAVEPDGRFLDVAGWPTGTPGPIVLEVSVPQGKLVKQLSFSGAASLVLTSVRGGLWVSWRAGMRGAAAHFAEGSLFGRTSALKTETGRPPVPGVETSMGVRAAYMGGDLVILMDATGASCVTASGESVVASAPFAGCGRGRAGRSWAPYGARGGVLYATTEAMLSTPAYVLAVTMPHACAVLLVGRTAP